jgi:hypothetical protein
LIGSSAALKGAPKFRPAPTIGKAASVAVAKAEESKSTATGAGANMAKAPWMLFYLHYAAKKARGPGDAKKFLIILIITGFSRLSCTLNRCEAPKICGNLYR